MDTYQLKLDIYFSNVCLYGDLFLEDDQQKLQYRNYDLGKVGLPGAVMIGTSLSEMTVLHQPPKQTIIRNCSQL